MPYEHESESDNAHAPKEKLATCPRKVYVAASIWVYFGLLTALIAVAGFFMGPLASGDANNNYGIWPSVIRLIFGAVFIHVGQYTTHGKALDTLGNGIGSLVFGLLNGASGVVIVTAFATMDNADAWMGVLFGCASIFAGIALIFAGVLALIGRQEYRAWQQA